MPPCSYVVSFGDIHRYLVETRTTSSQEGIVRWTVILRNLGLFPCASSSTRYELRGGIVWIQLPKECSLKWSASFLLHSSSPYNLTYIYPRRISSSSHHYPWQGFPWLLIKRSRTVVLRLFPWSGTHDPHRINNLLCDTLASSFIEFISSLLLLRLNYGQFKLSDRDARLDRGVMSWIISIYFLLPRLTPFAYHPD